MRFIQFLVLIIFALLIHNNSLYAEKYNLNGYVKDSVTGESLFSANVFIVETQQGICTNSYGYYSLNLPEGNYTIAFSYIGYNTKTVKIKLSNSVQFNCYLVSQTSQINEVVITNNQEIVEKNQVSLNSVSIERVKSVTTATGEPDVLKTLQLMPGVQSANEGATNLYVRGGSFDQNLYLLDEAPVYNPAHSLGFFSSFNPDALKSVEIYKGCFPARYGGRLSSVVNLTMREGNYNQMQITGGIGIIASRLTIEGPIKKEKSSFIISGRLGYPGSALNLLHQIAPNAVSNNNKIWFYDLNAKANLIIDSKNHLYFSTYSGYDKFYCVILNKSNQTSWGNFTSTLRWNHNFSGKWFMNLTSYYSEYNYSYTIFNDVRNFLWESEINEIGLKADFSYFLNQRNNLRIGVNSVMRRFLPGKISKSDDSSVVKEFMLDKKRSIENCFYFENDYKSNGTLSINYGIRMSLFTNIGPGKVFTYNSDGTLITDSTEFGNFEVINNFMGIEPRLSFRQKIGDNNAIKLAYALSKQNLHLLSNSTVGLPTDTWLPPDKYIKPQSSHQFVAGYYRSFFKKTLDLSIETYYKKLLNIIDFKNNADLLMNKNIETQVLSGNGYSYGMEILLEKKAGKLSGWIGYSLAKTKYIIPGINNGNQYSPRYDIRHNISLTGDVEANKNWTFSSTFKFSSGGFITLPNQVFYVDGATFFDYGNKNNYQLPAYHRLDISAIYNSNKNNYRRFKSQWVFSVYNVYNRKNIYSLFVQQESLSFASASVSKMYLFTIVPTIAYNVKF
jgi:hypothetical protein